LVDDDSPYCNLHATLAQGIADYRAQNEQATGAPAPAGAVTAWWMVHLTSLRHGATRS
jgi:hypothetical protein